MVGELSKQTGKTPSYIVRGAVQVYFWLGRYLLERARAGDAALLDALGQDLALPGAWKN